MAYFFRDPWRVTPTRPGLLRQPGRRHRRLARAGAAAARAGDGRRRRSPRIGIFLNVFDVHVARAPVGGRVAALRYTKGRFVNASLDKASEDNERLAIRIAPPEGPEIAFVLIAGLVARRIVCDLYEGQQVARRRSASASSASARGSMFIARRLMFRWWSRGSAWSAARRCSPTGSREEPRGRH